MTPGRIHITGGQGSGKSTLAARLHAVTGLPLHELDRIARVGGGNGPERPPVERDAMVLAISADDVWITEGVHLGWTEPLLARAQAIVWLDHVRTGEVSARMVRRFLAGGWHEFRSRRGRERFTRVGDYVRHVRDLGGAMRGARSTNDPDPFAAVLAAYAGTVIRCRSAADIEAFVSSLTSVPAPDRGPAAPVGPASDRGPAAPVGPAT